MMPIRKSNSFVLDVLASEITPFADIPVFFGASVMDCEDDLGAVLDRVLLAAAAKESSIFRQRATIRRRSAMPSRPRESVSAANWNSCAWRGPGI
jgi:hypothetical protein